MARMIFVNLPVRDLPRSIAFYKAIGAVQNEQFSDDTAAMVSFSAEINVMLLTHERFQGFTTRKLIDAHEFAQVGLALSAEDRAEVDALVETAGAAGGTIDPNPVEDHGWMYSRGFADPDGHIWEPVWMDVAAAAQAMAPVPTDA